MKLCKSCDQIKNSDEFYIRTDRKNSLQHVCKACSKLRKAQWQKVNKDKTNANSAKYRKTSKNFKSNEALRRKKRYSTDINYKLKHTLRTRLNSAVRNNQKSGSAISDLGCSIEDFKIYLESKFLPDMSWENWTFDGWHIDHIVAISTFNLTNIEELKKACHYTNLQPLWAKDNLSKGNK
jgi:hypothetical protein